MSSELSSSVAVSSSFEVESSFGSVVSGIVVGSLEKKNEVEGVGEASLAISSDSRSEGLTVTGLMFLTSF